MEKALIDLRASKYIKKIVMIRLKNDFVRSIS